MTKKNLLSRKIDENVRIARYKRSLQFTGSPRPLQPDGSSGYNMMYNNSNDFYGRSTQTSGKAATLDLHLFCSFSTCSHHYSWF